MYSIIIPTFNNLEYLQLTLNSIHKNSKYNHEIIIHINEGTDGTLEFIKKEKIKYTYSTENLGLCTAVNLAAEKATTDYILYCHDDMYLCPNWAFYLNEEVKFFKQIKSISTHIPPFKYNIQYLNTLENAEKEPLPFPV